MIKIPITHTAILVCMWILVIALSPIYSETVISGVAETKGLGRISDDSYYVQAEQFANIRMRSTIGEYGEFHSAVQLIVSSNTENEFCSQAELERLYLSLVIERFDIKLGLQRLPFGYGFAFRPLDMFTQPSVLYPEARPKGVLSSLVTVYPRDELSFSFFCGQQRDDVIQDTRDPVFYGLALTQHHSVFSTQFLYALSVSRDETQPTTGSGGFSTKVDSLIGIILEALYTHDYSSPFEEGSVDHNIQVTAGFDYSWMSGKLYLVTQYCYSSAGYLDSSDSISSLYTDPLWADLPFSERKPVIVSNDFYRRHYLYLSILWMPDSYTQGSLSVITALEDGSFLPQVQIEREWLQGCSLGMTTRMPLDMYTISSGHYGELGSTNLGFLIESTFFLKVRF